MVLKKQGSEWIAENNGVKICFYSKYGHEYRLRSGEIDPPMGWFSEAYGHKQETSVLSCAVEGKSDAVRFETVIIVAGI